MSWTKRQLIVDAFGEIALAGYIYDLDPEELEAALRKLDTQMASWTARGLDLGYAFGTSPAESDLDDDSGLPLVAVEAVYLALAKNLAASKGKTLLSSTLAQARSAYTALPTWAATQELGQVQLPSTLPLGAGNKSQRRGESRFFPQPDLGAVRDGPEGLDFGD